eukprot:9513319-Lingulodinium_polyedra.AAC.1
MLSCQGNGVILVLGAALRTRGVEPPPPYGRSPLLEVSGQLLSVPGVSLVAEPLRSPTDNPVEE